MKISEDVRSILRIFCRAFRRFFAVIPLPGAARYLLS